MARIQLSEKDTDKKKFRGKKANSKSQNKWNKRENNLLFHF